MFARLFVTYLVLVATAAGLVGLLAVKRTDGRHMSVDLAADVAAIVLTVGAPAVVPAYVLARRFTAPLAELADGARRVAGGDFGHQLRPAGGPEFGALARTFNDMSTRLADTFAQLARDRQQLRTILGGMVEGVVAFGTDRRVLFVNDRAADLLGFPAATAVGRGVAEVTRHRALTDLVDRALAGGGPHRQEVDLAGPQPRTLAVYVSRLPGPTPPGAVMVVHDTSDLRRLERLRQDFVANVSHELKTPLANIKSSVEVLLDGAADDPAVRGGFLAEIDQQADRLDALIQDLLTLARIESGETGLELAAVPVDDAVHACLDRHRTRAEANGLALGGVALGGAPPDLAVWGDDEGVAQILDNLIDNAIKYTPPGGRITVRWRVGPAGAVCLEVEDTGIGIPERDQPRIFERFYRVDKARSRGLGGTGLGLAIVKHLCQAMKGGVRVASEVGKGTTFTVTLPRAGYGDPGHEPFVPPSGILPGRV